ncbi:hypothetical protein [Glycomyces paridis]|uniref:Uncharacterized protein n=1 Tax=Glycomyces paridis TaxID=2126555 RepID=A0A4S8P0J4_9ACTN|nr:hypothetical protein [Glycomyces paridis]THV23533.1 hypothetical protein E9998_22300 [Glycomyces paridis]
MSAEHEVAVAERARVRDVVLFAVTAVAVAATPWMLVSAGSDPVYYRDSRGLDTEAPAWAGVLVYLVPLLAWSGAKLFHLLRSPAAAVVGPGGIRLYGEAIGGLYLRKEEVRVEAPWEQVQRIVLWRKQSKWLWCLPVWQSQVGVLKTSDWYTVSRREPSRRERESREVRRDGSPVRLGAMLRARSVRLSPRGAEAIAAAAARFAPGVEVWDERVHGKSRRIEAGPGRDPKTY